MAPAKLQITVESACNLKQFRWGFGWYTYVIVEVPGKEGIRMQTEVIDNELNPIWNFTGQIAGFMDGDILRFTVMDKDTPDDFLGKAELTAQDVYPKGFHGELALADSQTEATLSVTVAVIDCNELTPGLDQGEDAQIIVPGEMVEASSIEVLASGISMEGLQADDAGVTTTTTTTSHSMTDSAPQTDFSPQTDSSTYEAPQTDPVPQADSITYGAPQASVPSVEVLASGIFMQGLQTYRSVAITTTTTASHSMTHSVPQTASITYEAPQVPAPSDTVMTTEMVAQHPLVAVTAEECVKIKASVVESLAMASQSITYEAPQAPVPSESEEFANTNGAISTEPLPVTEGSETVTVGMKEEVEGLEMVFAGTKRAVDCDETVAVDETVKVKKKSKTCCC